VAEDGRLAAAIAARRHRADARFRDCVSRLETLSPLAVLARGYAVCWSADGTRIVRGPDDVDIGATVRVTLAKGDLDCEVRSKLRRS
jgi:exodeoxyribonuclease VII large subunit